MTERKYTFGDKLAISADELSKLTGLSKDTIYRLRAQREIPYVQLGRRYLFPVKEIEKWLAESTVEARER